MTSQEEPWRDALATLVASAPDELRALASDQLHIGGFTNVQLDHPVLDLRGIDDPATAHRALIFFLVAALLRGAALARVHVAKGPTGAELASVARRQLGPLVDRIDAESVSLLRYFDVYLKPADELDDATGRRLVRRVASALQDPSRGS